MIWERDYMKRRSDAKSDADAFDAGHTEASAPEPIDIFAGVERQPLSSQVSPTKASSDNLKATHPAHSLSAPADQAVGQQELLLNRLLAKYPRLIWYAAIAVVGIIVGILLGKNL